VKASISTPPHRGDVRCIIVGAGIGGLAAGIALRRQGWDVTILEKSPEVRAAGLALSLAPNATRALDELGILPDVLDVSVRVKGGEAMDRHGRVLKRVEFAPEHSTIPHPMVFLLRSALHKVLQKAFGATIRVGTRVASVDAETGRVTLEDGSSLEADVVIGADGLRSVVRTAVLGPASPRPVGVDAFRGLVEDDHTIEPGFARLLFARGTEAGWASCGPGIVYWYVSAPQGRYKSAAEAGQTFPAIVRDRIARTPADRIRQDVIYDWPPAPTWHKGKTVLLGDAVHAMAPHAGQGAAQAIIDAAALTHALGDGSRPLEEAFRAYESARMPEAQKAVRASRRNARVSLIQNPVACFLRDLGLRMMPSSMMARAFGGVKAPTR
jgi:2-polyprenyl-6-methoxyphenol hydroxylase-like FAD-dependent oxidoreductase